MNTDTSPIAHLYNYCLRQKSIPLDLRSALYPPTTTHHHQIPPLSLQLSLPNPIIPSQACNHGHRRHPRLRGPRSRRKPGVRRARPPDPHAVLGRRARRLGGPPMARTADGASNGPGANTGTPNPSAVNRSSTRIKKTKAKNTKERKQPH